MTWPARVPQPRLAPPVAHRAGAEVRQAEDLATLAAEINAEHEAGEGATRQGLEHFRAAGERLIKAKTACGHGKWLPWLKKNVWFSRPTASVYMRIAEEWDKVLAASNLRDALRLLTEDAPDDGNGEPSPPPLEYVTLDQWGEMGKAPQAKLLRTKGEGLRGRP